MVKGGMAREGVQIARCACVWCMRVRVCVFGVCVCVCVCLFAITFPSA